MTQKLEIFFPTWLEYSCKNPEQIYVLRAQYLQNFLLFCRDHMYLQNKYLIDITAVDYPTRRNRFIVVYNLLSIMYRTRIRVKVCIDECTPLQSSTGLYPCANWWEREVWDMYGIYFLNHPDCRRLLTDYGFEGHPLRKDFPLSGYIEVTFDESEKRVVRVGTHTNQEFRHFDFSLPWSK